MKRSIFVLAVAVCASLAGAQTIFGGSNVITNGSAEAGPATAGGARGPLPSWNGIAGVGIYGATQWWEIPEGSWSDGTQFFHGGSEASNVITQVKVLDAADLATVDAGLGLYSMSGWFGGWLGQDDNATLVARFLDGGGAALGTSDVLGGFLAADRNGLSSMLFDSTTGTIAAGTRSIEFVLTSTRVGGGTSNDGVADNLQFTAEVIPEPGTLAVLGLAGLVAARRRRASR